MPTSIVGFRAGPRMPVWVLLAMLGMEWLGGGSRALAFPPALHHIIYGTVRDEWGAPVSGKDVQVLLETSSGVKLAVRLGGSRMPGANYEFRVPMDAGLLASPYKPTALRPFVPFRIRVRIGGTVFLPIQMQGDFAKLGQPGKRTHLDLTLGEDSDGDGLPDSWERTINEDISKVTPEGDSDGDKMSNLDEYLAGTYAFDSEHQFSLTIARLDHGAAVLEFTGLKGRTYSVESSPDLAAWGPVEFRRAGAEGGPLKALTTLQVGPVAVIVATAEDAAHPAFYRLVVR